MKKILISILFSLVLCFSLQAQEKPIAITYEEFQSWMKTLTPLGYPFTETGKNGNEYLATFLKEKELKMIGITLAPLSAFDDYKKFKGALPYDFKGHRAVFYGTQNFWNLSIESKNLNACFQVTTVYLDATREQLEKAVEESGVLEKKHQ